MVSVSPKQGVKDLRIYRALAAIVSLSAFAFGQNKNDKIKEPPVNIQYGKSCNPYELFYWISAPTRGYRVQIVLSVGDSEPLPALVWLGFGFNKISVNIGQHQGTDCTLLVAPSWINPVFMVTNYQSGWLFRVPSDPSLKGLPLFSQALYGSTKGLAMSRGVQMSVM